MDGTESTDRGVTEAMVEAAMREHDYSLDRDTTRAVLEAAMRLKEV